MAEALEAAAPPGLSGSVPNPSLMTESSENALPRRDLGRVFIGREAELAALRAGLEGAISGRGKVFLVAGEPGIGKSELADRLTADAAADGAQVLWGRSWEGEGAP